MQYAIIVERGLQMDRARAKALISILRNSTLYETLPHEEKMSLLLRLEKDYPCLFSTDEYDPIEGSETNKK
jgi:hypothetical protein